MKKLLLNFKNCDVYLKTWTKYLKKTCGEVNYVPSLQPSMTKNKYPLIEFSSRSFVYVLGRASLRNTTNWVLPKLWGPDYWVHQEVLTNIFFMIKKVFFVEWIYIYVYIFFSVKNVFIQ